MPQKQRQRQIDSQDQIQKIQLQNKIQRKIKFKIQKKRQICFILIALFTAISLIFLSKIVELQSFLIYDKWMNITDALPRWQAQQFLNYRILKDDPNNKLSEQQYQFYDVRYKIGSYKKQLPFCIVVTGYNNNHDKLIQNNLNSIFIQNYTNYHVVYYDDASTDGTYQKVLEYVQRNPQIKEKTTIHRNEQNVKSLVCLVRAAHNDCKSQQIFLIVDADDQLVGKQVLKLFNAIFQQKNAYFIYTNFIDSSRGVTQSNKKYNKSIIKQNSYRSAPWLAGHLQGFYTQLLRRIEDNDLKDPNGKYFISAQDVVVCIPILEMSHERVQYLPQLPYYYNSQTGLNDHSLRGGTQQLTQSLIRRYKKYNQITDWFPNLQQVGKL